ncbi:MAG: penicillin-binding protein 2 [bacterium]|nr:penicillin-binding protein 2 [bacterium]
MLASGQRGRARVVWMGAMVACVVLLLRLYDVQCRRFGIFMERARQQHNSRGRILAWRGKIYDRHGNVLAMSVARPGLWADPGMIQDAGRTARVVAEITGLPYERVYGRLTNTVRRFVWIAKQISDAQAMQLRVLIKRGELRGVMIEELEHRVYPKGALLGNVLGFCDARGRGAEGIELAAERYLGGIDGYLMARRDNKRRIYVAPEWVGKLALCEPEDGHDVYLTIDEYLQHVAERELAAMCEVVQPTNAAALLMEPRTGQILAYALWPPFDPNDRGGIKAGRFRNHAAIDVFEPGSVMKAFTGAIALELGVMRLDTPIYCENGVWEALPSYTLHDDHPFGTITFKQVIQYSSNIGAAKIAQNFDARVYYEYLRRFGFGERTRTPLLVSESPGLLRPVRQWTRHSMVALPMGHEIGVTALQMLSAMSVIANYGRRVQPTLVKRIQTAKGVLTPEARTFNYFEPVVVDEAVISSNACAQIIEALCSVTEDDGTGRLAAIPGYKVAGKTGTAQVARGGRYTRAYVASFAGFVPAERAALCGVVVIKEPRSREYYGGLIAAPVFQKICSEALQYLKVPKEGVGGEESTTVARVD